MSTNTKIRIAVLTILAIPSLVAPRLAQSQVFLPPGGTVSVTGTTVAANPALAGVIIAETTDPIFNIAGPNNNLVFSGALKQSVLRESATGTLDFYYQIIEDNLSTQPRRFDDRWA